MRESVKLAREILAQPAFEEFCDYEIKPGIDVQIDEFVRENSETEHHPWAIQTKMIPWLHLMEKLWVRFVFLNFICVQLIFRLNSSRDSE